MTASGYDARVPGAASGISIQTELAAALVQSNVQTDQHPKNAGLAAQIVETNSPLATVSAQIANNVFRRRNARSLQ